MAALTGLFISQSYGGVVHLTTNTGIVGGVFTQLQDGFGNNLGLQVNGSSVSASFTGSLFGTASYASNANSASYALNASSATSASFATTAASATSASFATTAASSSYALSASFAPQPVFNTSSLATTGSNTFVGNQIITGSLVTTGSISSNVTALTIVSNTASMDLSTNNLFTIQLPNTSSTFINITNPRRGQTAMLELSQSLANATVTFSSNVTFPSGSAYTASFTNNAVDIVSFVSFNGSTLRAISAKLFI
jgi:hypothetical protein